MYASANVRESSKDIGKSCFRMYLINVWRRFTAYDRIFIGRHSRSHMAYKYQTLNYHNMSAVREVEVADPIAP